MNLTERRTLLKTADNPNRTIDYIVTLEALGANDRVRISLRYIPDRLIIKSDCFSAYIKALFESVEQTIEEGAAILVDDINNELVTRWVQVIVFEDQGKTSQHSVVIEDRQPNWDNPHLIARMTTI